MSGRSTFGAARKTLHLGALSLFSSPDRLRRVNVRESLHDNTPVRSYTSARSVFPIVALHGLTREGPDDLRLVQFCKMLAAAGMTVYTPSLPGLRMLDPDTADLGFVSALLTTLAHEHKSQIGLIGGSFGGTYSLLVSALPEVAHVIRFVLAIGPYYSLSDVVDRAFSLRSQHDLAPVQAYGLLALAWKYRASLPLTASELAAFEEVMRSCSCAEAWTADEAALIAKITNLQQQEAVYGEWKRRLPQLECLSIKDNPTLGSINAPVFLLHGEDDIVIPVQESLRIENELTRLRKDVVRHIGRFAEHVEFSIQDDAGLAYFFYRIMRMTEPQNNETPARNEHRGTRAT